MTCIITGCALVDDRQGRCVWGDLHEIGESYVFNAVLDHGETAWQHGAPVHDHMKQLVIADKCPADAWFERRGVFVLAKQWGELNRPAREYLMRSRA